MDLVEMWLLKSRIRTIAITYDGYFTASRIHLFITDATIELIIKILDDMVAEGFLQKSDEVTYNVKKEHHKANKLKYDHQVITELTIENKRLRNLLIETLETLSKTTNRIKGEI